MDDKKIKIEEIEPLESKSLKELIEAMEPDFVEFTKSSLGPWSHSKLKVLQQCPLNFYLKYIIKFKGPTAPPSLVTNVGKAVHTILEHVILGKSITDSFALAKKEYAKIITEDEWVDQVATTELNIIEFRQRLDGFEKNFPIKRYVQELRAGVTEEFQPTGFFDKEVFWRGVIDFGMQLESNDLIVLDHKTGAPAAMGIKNFKPQLDSYKVLYHFGIQPINGAQSGIHFVKAGEIILDDYVPKETIEGKLRTELEFIIQGTIDKALNLGFFKHIRGPYCKWCDFNVPCAAKELTDIELKTKRFFPIKEIK